MQVDHRPGDGASRSPGPHLGLAPAYLPDQDRYLVWSNRGVRSWWWIFTPSLTCGFGSSGWTRTNNPATDRLARNRRGRSGAEGSAKERLTCTNTVHRRERKGTPGSATEPPGARKTVE